MKYIMSFIVFILLASFVGVSNLAAQDTLSGEQAKIAQEKLEKALQALKKEVKGEIKVENGGTITGKVDCKRVKHPENVVVYLEKVDSSAYEESKEHGILDQLNLTFVPHVIAIQKGTTIDFPNSDSVRHNVFTPPDCCRQFNLGTYDVGVVKSVTFDESCDVPILCNVHAEMSAFVVVLDNPFFSFLLKDGVYKIENVPPGTYKIAAWHETLQTVVKDVTADAGKTVNVDFQLKKRK